MFKNIFLLLQCFELTFQVELEYTKDKSYRIHYLNSNPNKSENFCQN